MSLGEAAKWNKRAAAVYALGVWGMIGSFAFLKYTGRLEDTPGRTDSGSAVCNTNNRFSAYNKTVITYRKDFVPYSTRIYNFIRSFSSEPGTGDSEK
uniref:Small integral membrane protein 26 n=1 Tax=Echeneis naucrates TaxID=173247 RepID=A0A665VA67_ECHNA